MPYNQAFMNNVVETKQEGRVLRVWLNRPDHRNLLTTELCRELTRTFDRAQKDSSVGSVLLAGKGDSFCAGMDFSELAMGDVEIISSVHRWLVVTAVVDDPKYLQTPYITSPNFKQEANGSK